MSLKELIENEVEFEEDLQLPRKFKVLLLNDDYTSMDFVVEVLMKIFHHDVETAVSIMLKVHEEGKGVCGVYTHEIAETKVAQVSHRAKAAQLPLRATMEEE